VSAEKNRCKDLFCTALPSLVARICCRETGENNFNHRKEFAEVKLFKPWTPFIGLLRVAWENITKTGKTPKYELHYEPLIGSTKNHKEHMNKKLLFSIIFVVFIDLLGFSLILPLLPYYAETFKASPFVTGLLVASYALAQLIGAPILGRMSDRYGRRPILLASIFGTFAGFLLLGFAKTLLMLFVARIIDGVTGGNLSIAQAYISDVTDAKNRSQGLA